MPKAKKEAPPTPKDTHTGRTKTQHPPEQGGFDASSIISGEITPTRGLKDILYAPPEETPGQPADTEEGQAEEEPAAPDAPEEETPEEPEQEPEADYRQRYEELQRKLGEQGNELGMYRQFIDQHLTAPVNQQRAPETPPEEIDFLENPEKAVQAIEQRVMQRLTGQMTGMMASNQGMQKLMSQHPDHMAVVNSPDFKEWALQTHPKSVLAVADKDPEAAAYILSQYKQGRSQPTPSVDEKSVANKISTKRMAARTTGGVVPGPKGSSGEKVFKRIELMYMMVNNPREYERLQPQILKAYREGRVK